jgi:hypothetical protein
MNTEAEGKMGARPGPVNDELVGTIDDLFVAVAGDVPHHDFATLHRVVAWGNHYWTFKENNKSRNIGCVTHQFLEYTEVIGNIYENPDLLKLPSSKTS